jgi:hypothetical protein
MPEASQALVLDGSMRAEDQDKDKREIGGDAVWTLSTAKPGNGVEQLRWRCCVLREFLCACVRHVGSAGAKRAHGDVRLTRAAPCAVDLCAQGQQHRYVLAV